MDQCSWRCKVHAHCAVPVSISHLKTKMNAAAVVTYLTSQAFNGVWHYPYTLVASLFFHIQYYSNVQFVFEAAVSMKIMIVLMYTVIDNPFTKPTLLLYGLTVEKNYDVNVSCKYWEKLWIQKFLVGLRAVFCICTWLPQDPTQSAP